MSQVETRLEEIRSRLKSPDPNTFWACEDAFRRLLQTHFAQAWINRELSRLLADDKYLGNWLPHEVVLSRHEAFSISITLFDGPLRYIHALPFLGFYAPLQSAVTIDVYSLPTAYRNDVFDPTLKLQLEKTVTVECAEAIKIESDRFAYDIKPVGPTPVLRFTTRALHPMEWLFSRTTLQAWQANDADLSFTQLRVAAYVLGKIAHHSSIDPLRMLASHPHHAVRWAAIQSLGRLNRSEALLKIREAVNDPHPHVRSAAQKTLDRLEGRTVGWP